LRVSNYRAWDIVRVCVDCRRTAPISQARYRITGSATALVTTCHATPDGRFHRHPRGCSIRPSSRCLRSHRRCNPSASAIECKGNGPDLLAVDCPAIALAPKGFALLSCGACNHLEPLTLVRSRTWTAAGNRECRINCRIGRCGVREGTNAISTLRARACCCASRIRLLESPGASVPQLARHGHVENPCPTLNARCPSFGFQATHCSPRPPQIAASTAVGGMPRTVTSRLPAVLLAMGIQPEARWARSGFLTAGTRTDRVLPWIGRAALARAWSALRDR